MAFCRKHSEVGRVWVAAGDEVEVEKIHKNTKYYILLYSIINFKRIIAVRGRRMTLCVDFFIYSDHDILIFSNASLTLHGASSSFLCSSSALNCIVIDCSSEYRVRGHAPPESSLSTSGTSFIRILSKCRSPSIVVLGHCRPRHELMFSPCPPGWFIFHSCRDIVHFVLLNGVWSTWWRYRWWWWGNSLMYFLVLFPPPHQSHLQQSLNNCDSSILARNRFTYFISIAYSDKLFSREAFKWIWSFNSRYSV